MKRSENEVREFQSYIEDQETTNIKRKKNHYESKFGKL